jgi:hypothetical protein
VFVLGNPCQSGLRRLEPTQLECLLDTSFLGKLLVYLANLRLDWKVIACYKQSGLFLGGVSDGENLGLVPGVDVDKHVFPHDVEVDLAHFLESVKTNKLGRLSLKGISSLV